MHGKVDVAAQKRVFDFLGEQTLSADLGQIPVLDSVSGRYDCENFDTHGIDTDSFNESLFDLLGLDDREP